MKHLKTGLYLLLVLVIILVPIASAAGTPWGGSSPYKSYKYKDQSVKLNNLGLYKGISKTQFDPDLGTSLNRETGVVMLLRTFGHEAEVTAMTDAQADTILINFTDATAISSWAKKSVAYAVKNQLVVGFPNGTLEPKSDLNGKAYCTMILRQLGYTPNYDRAPNELVDAGGLTTTQAAEFLNKTLKKDDLVGISYGALSAKDKKGESLIDKLVATKVINAGAAAEAGLTVRDTAGVASEAVAAYEAAPINTMEQIELAEKVEKTASDKVALVADAGTKAKLEARIKAQKAKVDTAKKKLQDPKSATATLSLTVKPKPIEYSSGGSSYIYSVPAMSGTVAITGTGKYGSTLTADPTALINAGTPTYQWNRNGAAIGGATTSTYTLATADIGAVITVTATANGVAGIGSITSAPTAAIAKADGPAAPAPPTAASKTPTSISLAVYAQNQFSIDAGVNWQDSETFTGLTASTAYTFVARVKETATTNASAASGGTSITTVAVDATLHSLVCDGPLQQNDGVNLGTGFIAGCLQYKLAPALTTTITATADAGATMTYSSVGGPNIALAQGTKTPPPGGGAINLPITITVTAEDGVTTKQYTVVP